MSYILWSVCVVYFVVYLLWSYLSYQLNLSLSISKLPGLTAQLIKRTILLYVITGVLKTPVRLSCGKDPCVGKLCPVDAQARCFTDHECKSTFWNLNTKEEINECKGNNEVQPFMHIFASIAWRQVLTVYLEIPFSFLNFCSFLQILTLVKKMPTSVLQRHLCLTIVSYPGNLSEDHG